MATEAERLYITLEARMDAYNRDLARAQALTHQKLGAMEARYQQMAARIKQSTADASAGLGTALGGVGLAIGAHAVLEYANEWTRLTRSLEGSEQAFGIVLKSGHEVTQLANEARIDVEAYAKTYVRAAAAVRDYGYTSNDAARVASTLAKALKLGQASASEQASTILQFSQALQKGKLDGDEFRTVMENAGIVQEILAQKLKVSKGEIIEIPCVEADTVVDPTGCGDAYRSGLLYGIANGWDWKQTGSLAAVMGAIKVAHQGCQSHTPSRDEIGVRYRKAFGTQPW